jgi:hypothetical protein
VRVFDHDDRGVDHGTDGNCNAAEAHDVRAKPEHIHTDIRDQYAERQGNDRNERTAHVKEEHEADEGDDDALFDQRSFEGLDGAIDQIRPVINRLNRNALRQARRDFRKAVLHVSDDRKCILPEALNRNPRNDLAFSVKFGDAAPLIGRELDAGDVSEQHRDATVVLDHDLFQVGYVLHIAAAANCELSFAQLHRPTADIAVARAQSSPYLVERYAQHLEPPRIDHDAVLLDEAADACDFRYPLGFGDRVPDLPVLDGTQFGKSFLVAANNVLVNPTYSGRVRPERRRNS